MPITTDLAIVNRIPFAEIEHICLGMDVDKLSGAAAMFQATHQRGYDPSAMKTAAKHLELMEKKSAIDSNSFAIVESCRNLVNNKRCFAYFGETESFCAPKGEAPTRSERPYYGLEFKNDGAVLAHCVDFRQTAAPSISTFLTGTPVLWNNEVSELELLCVEASDSTHVWKIERKDPVSLKLTRVFELTKHAPLDIAAYELIRTANTLPRDDSYLHHAIGVCAEALYSIVAVGSLERIGQIAKNAGATSAIVVDNGGSVSFGLRRPGRELRHLYESWYFREPAVAVIAYQLTADPDGWAPFQGKSDLLSC